MKMSKGKFLEVVTLVFALSLASVYVVRSQLSQSRSVASSSKSLAPVVSPTTGKAPATNQTFSTKTNGGVPASKPASTGSVAKASSSLTVSQSVSGASSRVMFPGSKSGAVFDFQQS